MRLREAIAVLAAGLSCSVGLPAATAYKKTAATHKTAAVAGKKRPAARHTATRHTARSKHPTRTARKKQPRSTWRQGQMTPTPDRYREIQSALATRGYLHGEPTGVWDQDSADALRRFQQDQNINANGKLDSLSIIALGLGPKY